MQRRLWFVLELSKTLTLLCKFENLHTGRVGGLTSAPKVIQVQPQRESKKFSRSCGLCALVRTRICADFFEFWLELCPQIMSSQGISNSLQRERMLITECIWVHFRGVFYNGGIKSLKIWGRERRCIYAHTQMAKRSWEWGSNSCFWMGGSPQQDYFRLVKMQKVPFLC